MSVAKASPSVVPGYGSPRKALHQGGVFLKVIASSGLSSLQSWFSRDLLRSSWLCSLFLRCSNSEELFGPCPPPQVPKWPGRVL